MTRARSEERGNDMRDGERIKESVWTPNAGVGGTGPGVGGTDGPNGKRGNKSFENRD